MPIDYTQLNLDGQLDLLLNDLPYPLNKAEIIEHIEAAQANTQVVNALKRVLPNKEFTSAEEIRESFQLVALPQHSSKQPRF